jgi:hypothetical protein
VMEVGRGLVLAAWALLMALLEIEIEGRHGWAERLPTWYRTGGPAARVYHAIGGMRPLTGYHLMMFPIPLLLLHYPYVAGADWSLASEASTIAVFLAWIIAWDYLWFVLNPYWGLARFRRGEVWWYPGRWIGRLPLDYYLAVGASFAVAALAWALGGGAEALRDQLVIVAILVATCLACMALAGPYGRWYAWMRRPGSDQRDEAGIRPPPD